ncbi:hypothetical protein [Gluconacetobacter takamatsuzukensis]|uniref:Uncharacterized protein n=1 Tax=Gluconacetobacter takamatsuzukensis TaxID=1286190 RepID=A0A7W4KEP1_9PROT|nr:hypothetical protein [Gluconacetobacter takamatsuzukensis]MBB2205546.1 hypothetical protein [Gluconacetobacter takamatsuzukensis]
MSKHVPPELAALLRESFAATSHPRKATAKPSCSKMHIDRIYPTGGGDIFIEFSDGPEKVRGNTVILQITEKFIDDAKNIIDSLKRK